MIRHLVAVRFRDDLDSGVKDAILRDLVALRDHLDGILDVRVGRNVSPEDPVVHGLRDIFWFDFQDAAARDTYLADPAHRAVGARLVDAAGGRDGIVVVDFEI